jgi:hypothetical protein
MRLFKMTSFRSTLADYLPVFINWCRKSAAGGAVGHAIAMDLPLDRFVLICDRSCCRPSAENVAMLAERLALTTDASRGYFVVDQRFSFSVAVC